MSRLAICALVFVVFSACDTPQPAGETEPGDAGIDERSYQLGVIGAFSEVVGMGVKKLALSSAMSPSEMAGLIDEARKIVERNGAESFLETDFLVTDLFPPEVTDGKHILFIYTGSTREEYEALKKRKQELVAQETYQGDARKEIARGMGRLLSYPEDRIERMLSDSE